MNNDDASSSVVFHCIFCGKKEVMLGYICLSCQDRIQQEVMRRRNEMRQQAQDAIREYGANPDNNNE